jgi:imidazolonepropionase-like amidohydrolase
MRQRGRSLVLTLALADVDAKSLPPDCWAEAERVLPNRLAREPHQRESIAIARRKGILCGSGGDGGATAVPHDFRMARELAALVTYGYSPLEAITIATHNNARIVGWEAELGTLEVGKLADFVILKANPLDDIRHIRDVDSVYLGGRLVQSRSAD